MLGVVEMMVECRRVLVFAIAKAGWRIGDWITLDAWPTLSDVA